MRMSLRIIVVLAVLSGVSEGNNVTAAPETDTANTVARPISVQVTTEKTEIIGKVRVALVCYRVITLLLMEEKLGLTKLAKYILKYRCLCCARYLSFVHGTKFQTQVKTWLLSLNQPPFNCRAKRINGAKRSR